MDATLKSVAALTKGADVEARCAALIVLTHLRADDGAIVRTVAEALNAKNTVVRDFALTYFEQVRPRAGLDHLLPLLDGQEDALRQRVVGILATYGATAVTAVRKLLEDAPRRRLYSVIALCARVRSSGALDVLFDLMASDDLDTNRAACDATLGIIPGLDERGRRDLFARSEALCAAAKGQRPALVAAAKLFGGLADPKAKRRLFAMLGKQHPQAVRTHALAAMTNCLRGQKLTTAEIHTLMPFLDEDDEAGVLRPVVHLLEDQQLDRSDVPELNRLAESPQPVVKRFAVQKLGSFESGSVVKTLIGYLTDDSYARRDQAAASLKTLPAARPALMKELLTCDDERKAWTLADILLLHDRSWKRDSLDALWKRLEQALERREDRLYTAYFHFLNALDPAALAARIRERAERLRKSKHFALSAKWLSLLKDSPAFDAEAQYALAIAELKAHRRMVSAASRRHDPAIDLLKGLSRSTFPVAERLRKERLLTPEEMFYLGFTLAEGDADERTVASDLLQLLAAKHGRTKAGKAAKNKLRLLGGKAQG